MFTRPLANPLSIIMVVASASSTTAPAISYAKPIAWGLLVALAGVGPWILFARLNATIRPDLPWAALATAVYLAALLSWLNGFGPPGASAGMRRDLLNLWPTDAKSRPNIDGLSIGAMVALLAGLYAAWIVVGWTTPIPDLTVYSTSSYRWSMFLMGPVTAGVVEEAAFRGYMQRGLERVDPANALWITSLVFVAAHITHGLGAVVLLGPGLFAVSMLYGALARRIGSIVPGMVIHTLGDMAYMYFGVLRGDGSLLFVQ